MESSTKFNKRIQELKTDCKVVAEGMRGQGQLCWMFGLSEDIVGPFDLDGIHEMFDRSDLEKDYVNAITGVDKTAVKQDLSIATAQSDILSGIERDYLARHRTRIRKLAHESVAKRHSGSVHGMMQAGLLHYLEYQMQRTTAGEVKEDTTNG